MPVGDSFTLLSFPLDTVGFGATLWSGELNRTHPHPSLANLRYRHILNISRCHQSLIPTQSRSVRAWIIHVYHFGTSEIWLFVYVKKMNLFLILFFSFRFYIASVSNINFWPLLKKYHVTNITPRVLLLLSVQNKN